MHNPSPETISSDVRSSSSSRSRSSRSLPFVFMSVTAFVKISTVLQIVRSAIGAQNVPSNTVVMALAAALTLLAMAPVGEKIWTKAEPLFTAERKRSTRGRSCATASTPSASRCAIS